jgi:hypothetical protein
LLSLADAEVARLLASVPEDVRNESSWLVHRDGAAVRLGAGGAGRLLVELRLTRRLGRALEAVGASRLLDALVRLVSRHRARIGRFVPDGPAPRRYP